MIWKVSSKFLKQLVVDLELRFQSARPDLKDETRRWHGSMGCKKDNQRNANAFKRLNLNEIKWEVPEHQRDPIQTDSVRRASSALPNKLIRLPY